ncbi:MAG: hypothetical protein HYV02_05435 [Deltaproteobacteria bacterium]|nr:hypothetical protein [Deltaproteobacteria bacterium]
MSGSVFSSVQWLTGTRPRIPALQTTRQALRPVAPWIVQHFPAQTRSAFETWRGRNAPGETLESALGGWLHRQPAVTSHLPFATESYRLHAVPFRDTRVAGARLFLGYVPPTEIFGKPRTAPMLESIHNFFYAIEGYYVLCGFPSPTERNDFVRAFEHKTLPPGATFLRPSGIHFFSGGWAHAGEMVCDGATWSLALLTPQAFAFFLPATRYEEIAPAQLYRPGAISETTANGTTYVFHPVLGFIGYEQRGHCYRLCRDPDQTPGATVASHVEILRRQLDPYGLGLTVDRPLATQFVTARSILDEALHSIGVSTVRSEGGRSAQDMAALVREINLRLVRVRRAAAAHTGGSTMVQALQLVHAGIDAWRRVADGTPRQQHLRFIWLRDAESLETGFVASRDETFLHYQLALMALGPDALPDALAVGAAALLLQQLRGGALVLDYDTTGLLRDVQLVDTQMLFPGRPPFSEGGEGLQRIVMTAEERAELLRRVRCQIHERRC